MGTPGPEVLQDFLIEREFWKELGLTREALRDRPWREVQHYALIIQLIRREENARAARANRRK